LPKLFRQTVLQRWPGGRKISYNIFVYVIGPTLFVVRHLLKNFSPVIGSQLDTRRCYRLRVFTNKLIGSLGCLSVCYGPVCGVIYIG